MKLPVILVILLMTNCSNLSTESESINSKSITLKSTDSKITDSKNKDPEIIEVAEKAIKPNEIPPLSLDSVVSRVKINNIDTFDIKNLQTDNFNEMIHMDKNLYKIIYPNQNNYINNSFYILSQIPNNKNYHTLITYQKNYEGEDYRVDYVEMINISKDGLLLDRIRLAAEDNAVIIYEVRSILNGELLTCRENIGTEPNFETNIDTVHMTNYKFKLFGEQRIDTISIDKKFELLGI